MTIGDRKVPSSAGAVLYAPKGVWHGIDNTGSETPAQIAESAQWEGNMSTTFRIGEPWNGRRLVRFISRAAAIALVLIAGLLLGTTWLIESGVHAASKAALLERPGDRVPALMAYVESPTHALRERNRAVWALGQLGDARALPVLEKYATGRECDHARALCQYELRKAMRLCHGATNLSAFIWR